MTSSSPQRPPNLPPSRIHRVTCLRTGVQHRGGIYAVRMLHQYLIRGHHKQLEFLATRKGAG